MLCLLWLTKKFAPSHFRLCCISLLLIMECVLSPVSGHSSLDFSNIYQTELSNNQLFTHIYAASNQQSCEVSCQLNGSWTRQDLMQVDLKKSWLQFFCITQSVRNKGHVQLLFIWRTISHQFNSSYCQWRPQNVFIGVARWGHWKSRGGKPKLKAISQFQEFCVVEVYWQVENYVNVRVRELHTDIFILKSFISCAWTHTATVNILNSTTILF